MTPLRLETIQEKIFRLTSNADFVQDIMDKEGIEVIKNPGLYNGIQHMMQIAIESIMDIGSHILAEKFKDAPKEYKDIVPSLGKYGVIPMSLAAENEKISSFRNVLVHEYDKIDDKKVVEYAQKAPAIFRDFAKAFLEFVDKEKTISK